jgi:hypothetical protein
VRDQDDAANLGDAGGRGDAPGAKGDLQRTTNHLDGANDAYTKSAARHSRCVIRHRTLPTPSRTGL